MIEDLLARKEGKTLEFKEAVQNHTFAFANTAGRLLVLGIKGKSKKVVGLANCI